MDPERLAYDLPVEYLRDDDELDAVEGSLRQGHPGRITDPCPQDVLVEWWGLEGKGASSWTCYDYESLGELDQSEYDQRVQRLRDGLPPAP